MQKVVAPNLAHAPVNAPVQNKASQRSGRTSCRGVVSAGRGVLDVHEHRAASSSMLMCHQADPGSSIYADASRCEATDLLRPCAVALEHQASLHMRAQRPSETQLRVVSHQQEKRWNEIHV